MTKYIKQDQLIAKLKTLATDVVANRGDILFFALALRDKPMVDWDLLLAAPWAERNDRAIIAYVYEKMTDQLTQEELASIGRVIILDSHHPDIPYFSSLLRSTDEVIELANLEVLGVELDKLVIIPTHSEPVLSI